MTTLHVTPRGDLVEHDISSSSGQDCVCGPTTIPVPGPHGSMGWLVRHASLDGRELAEPGR